MGVGQVDLWARVLSSAFGCFMIGRGLCVCVGCVGVQFWFYQDMPFPQSMRGSPVYLVPLGDTSSHVVSPTQMR